MMSITDKQKAEQVIKSVGSDFIPGTLVLEIVKLIRRERKITKQQMKGK